MKTNNRTKKNAGITAYVLFTVMSQVVSAPVLLFGETVTTSGTIDRQIQPTVPIPSKAPEPVKGSDPARLSSNVPGSPISKPTPPTRAPQPVRGADPARPQLPSSDLKDPKGNEWKPPVNARKESKLVYDEKGRVIQTKTEYFSNDSKAKFPVTARVLERTNPDTHDKVTLVQDYDRNYFFAKVEIQGNVNKVEVIYFDGHPTVWNDYPRDQELSIWIVGGIVQEGPIKLLCSIDMPKTGSFSMYYEENSIHTIYSSMSH